MVSRPLVHTKMLIKTTHAAYLFTLSIFLYALGLYYYYGFSNYFVIVPGWHIQFHIIYFYIGCIVTGVVNFLLYRKLDKKSPVLKVKRLILHILITVPLWMLCLHLQTYALHHHFVKYVQEGLAKNYYLKTFYKSIFLIFATQLFYWFYTFYKWRLHTSSKK